MKMTGMKPGTAIVPGGFLLPRLGDVGLRLLGRKRHLLDDRIRARP